MVILNINTGEGCKHCHFYQPIGDLCQASTSAFMPRIKLRFEDRLDNYKPDKWCPIVANLPKGYTNRDVLKALFPDSIAEVEKLLQVDKDWLDSPYPLEPYDPKFEEC